MSNVDRAAEIIEEWVEREYGNPEDNATSAAEALAAAGLLMPDGTTEEWEATVVWRTPHGQTEQWTGYGTTRDAALDDARSRRNWFVGGTEVTHRCARRLVTPWETTTETETP